MINCLLKFKFLAARLKKHTVLKNLIRKKFRVIFFLTKTSFLKFCVQLIKDIEQSLSFSQWK